VTREQAMTATVDELRDWLAVDDGWHYEAGPDAPLSTGRLHHGPKGPCVFLPVAPGALLGGYTGLARWRRHTPHGQVDQAPTGSVRPGRLRPPAPMGRGLALAGRCRVGRLAGYTPSHPSRRRLCGGFTAKCGHSGILPRPPKRGPCVVWWGFARCHHRHNPFQTEADE